jgi:hypothetical protein
VLRYILANAISKRAIRRMDVFVPAPLRVRPITFENLHEPSIMFLSGIRKAVKAKRHMLRAAGQKTILKSYLHPVYVFASAVLANYSFLLFPKLSC